MALYYNIMEPSYMRSVVNRNVVMRGMTVHDNSTENNDIPIQFISFTSRNTQYCNHTTIKDTTHGINLLHTAKDGVIYTTFNTQSGPVHLSCPPECCQLSLLLTGKQPVRTSEGFSHIFYTWAAAGGC
jgi:hypothetical protein